MNFKGWIVCILSLVVISVVSLRVKGLAEELPATARYDLVGTWDIYGEEICYQNPSEGFHDEIVITDQSNGVFRGYYIDLGAPGEPPTYFNGSIWKNEVVINMDDGYVHLGRINKGGREIVGIGHHFDDDGEYCSLRFKMIRQ